MPDELQEQIPLIRDWIQKAGWPILEKEGFEAVVPVVAKNQGLAPLLPGDPVEVAASQPRAEGAIGSPGGDLRLHHRVGIAILDAVDDAVG